MLSERGRHYEKWFNKTFAWRALAGALGSSRAGAGGRSGIYWVKRTQRLSHDSNHPGTPFTCVTLAVMPRNATIPTSVATATSWWRLPWLQLAYCYCPYWWSANYNGVPCAPCSLAGIKESWFPSRAYLQSVNVGICHGSRVKSMSCTACGHPHVVTRSLCLLYSSRITAHPIRCV